MPDWSEFSARTLRALVYMSASAHAAALTRMMPRVVKNGCKKAIRLWAETAPQWMGSHARWGYLPGVRSVGSGEVAAPWVVGARAFHPAWVAVRQPPKPLEGAVRSEFTRELHHALPGTGGAILPGGRALGREGVVLDRQGCLIAEPARLLAHKPYDIPALYRFCRPPERRLLGTWGLLAGCGGHGYFHWMMDVLPRAALISRLADVDQWLVGTGDKSFMAESMTLLGIKRSQVIGLGEQSHYGAENLVVASCPSVPGNPPPWVLAYLRQMVPTTVQAGSQLPERIYVSRRSAVHRRITNEACLVKKLESVGYTVVVLEAMSLKDQVRLFAGARSIISPHGAGLTNLTFCSRGARVLEIFAEGYVNVCYWAIANLAGLEYAYLVARPTEAGRDGAYTTDIHLAGGQIEMILRWADAANGSAV